MVILKMFRRTQSGGACSLFSLIFLLCGAASPAAAAGTGRFFRVGFFRAAGVGFRRFGGSLIGQPADPGQAVRLLGKPHPNEEFSMLRAGSQVHIPVSGLGKPPGTQHPPAADGTLILLPGHGGQGLPLVGIVVEYLPGNTAGKLRAVEAVFMAFQRRVILPRAFLQVQHGADQRRVVSVAQRVVGGLCFCLGLVLVLVCGAELFTGNSLMVCALKSKKITLAQMLKAWLVVWLGNFAGALFIVFLVYMAGIYKLNGEAVANSMVSVAAGKVTVDWVTIFFRGILCNIFVCLAVWIGTAGKTVVDKVVGILLPIAAFVACGFEHCVANMYFLPMGAVMHACGYGADVAGADALNVAGIAFNLSAATLGNIVGGAVLVALGYWFIYAKKSEA